MYWRHKFDAYRNGVAALAMVSKLLPSCILLGVMRMLCLRTQVHFSHKTLDKKKTAEKVSMLEAKGIKLSSQPDSLYFGTFIKREQFEVCPALRRGCLAHAQLLRPVV